MSFEAFLSTFDERTQRRLRKRMQRSNDAMLAAIAECFGPDSPLLDLFRDKTEAELMAEQIISGAVKLPDVEITTEMEEMFGF